MRKARANSATISLTSPRGPSALCCMDDEMSLPILRTSYCNLCLQQQPRKRVKENKAAGQATPCHTILARTPRRVQCFTKKKKREAPRSRMQSVSGCMWPLNGCSASLFQMRQPSCRDSRADRVPLLHLSNTVLGDRFAERVCGQWKHDDLPQTRSAPAEPPERLVMCASILTSSSFQGGRRQDRNSCQ